MTDRRPDPRPRKHAQLWQAYLIWDELMQMRKRHVLRLSSIEREKSNMDAEIETAYIEDALDPLLSNAQKEMVAFGKDTGPIWDWLTGIKGIGDHTAAKLLAQFDDPARYDTISKFWAFAGWAVREGEIDRCKKGEKAPYNRRLKSECYLVGEQFIRQQTPGYVDLYYDEKERQQRDNPNPVCSACGGLAELKGQSWKCPECKNGDKINYSPLHLHRRAARKMVKRFLADFWVRWRESEGLPVSLPYAFAVLGHSPEHYVEPAELPAS